MDFIKSFLHFIIFMSPIPEQHVLMHNSASTQSLAKNPPKKTTLTASWCLIGDKEEQQSAHLFPHAITVAYINLSSELDMALSEGNRDTGVISALIWRLHITTDIQSYKLGQEVGFKNKCSVHQVGEVYKHAFELHYMTRREQKSSSKAQSFF